LDADGRVRHVVGVADGPELRETIERLARAARTKGSRFAKIAIGDRETSALFVPFGGGGGVTLLGADAPDGALDFLAGVDFAYDIVAHLVSDPFEAMTVVDAEGRIAYISPVHERFFGLARGDAVGKPVREVIENTRLHIVTRTGKAEIGSVQRMRGAERVVTRVPIKRGDEIVGAIGRVMFKGPQQVETLNQRINKLESEVAYYKREAAAMRKKSYGIDSIVGTSRAIAHVRAQIVKVAPLEIPVLIEGESGTGKELVAHALHKLGPRRDGPLVIVNAAALPATLIEAELFGYEPGAFTGADRRGRKGRFEVADGGTIFLDEIGDMPIELQAKLLRVLQDRLVERVGGDKPRETDFRLVSATNRSLRDLIPESKFRLDLYYRISPIVISMPPLRQRVEDIPILATDFLEDMASRHRRPPPTLTQDAIAWLAEQPWPGNVRQLRNEIERAFVFADGDKISSADLRRMSLGEAAAEPHVPAAPISEPPPFEPPPFEPPLPEPPPALPPANMKELRDRAEADMIRAAMSRLKGNKKRVAADLGISRSYLYKRLRELLPEIDESV